MECWESVERKERKTEERLRRGGKIKPAFKEREGVRGRSREKDWERKCEGVTVSE